MSDGSELLTHPLDLLTPKLVDSSLLTELAALRAQVNQLLLQSKRSVTASAMTIDGHLGLMTQGEFRVGNGVEPGEGFTGGRMVFPEVTYDGRTYVFVGVNNDVAQVGFNTDGQVMAGAGDVVLDENGLAIRVGGGISNTITFDDGAGNTNGRISVEIETDSALLNIESQGNNSGEGIVILSAIAGGGTDFASMVHRASGSVASTSLFATNTSYDGLTIGADNSGTPAAMLDVRGTGKFTGDVDMNGNDINNATSVVLNEGAAPGTPAASKTALYALADGRPYAKDDAGVQYTLAEKHTARTAITNTTTKTAIYTSSVAANALNAKGFIDIAIPFIYTNNSGGNRSFTITVEFGATTLFAVSTGTINTNASSRVGRIVVRLANANATNAQECFLRYDLSAGAAAGSTSATSAADQAGYNTSAEDTTAAKTLAISITHSNNDTSLIALGGMASGAHNLA